MNIVQCLSSGLTPICNDHSWYSEVLNDIEKDYPQLAKVIRVER